MRLFLETKANSLSLFSFYAQKKQQPKTYENIKYPSYTQAIVEEAV